MICKVLWMFFTTQCQLLTNLDKKHFENIVEKEKMLVTSIFSLSLNVSYPIKDNLHHLSVNQIVVPKCLQFGQCYRVCPHFQQQFLSYVPLDPSWTKSTWTDLALSYIMQIFNNLGRERCLKTVLDEKNACNLPIQSPNLVLGSHFICCLTMFSV